MKLFAETLKIYPNQFSAHRKLFPTRSLLYFESGTFRTPAVTLTGYPSRKKLKLVVCTRSKLGGRCTVAHQGSLLSRLEGALEAALRPYRRSSTLNNANISKLKQLQRLKKHSHRKISL